MIFYVSFGQAHAHSIEGRTYDKDTLMAVEAPDELTARLGVNQLTGGKWCGIYQKDAMWEETLRYFPHGVVNADKPIRIDKVIRDTPEE